MTSAETEQRDLTLRSNLQGKGRNALTHFPSLPDLPFGLELNPIFLLFLLAETQPPGPRTRTTRGAAPDQLPASLQSPTSKYQVTMY